MVWGLVILVLVLWCVVSFFASWALFGQCLSGAYGHNPNPSIPKLIVLTILALPMMAKVKK